MRAAAILGPGCSAKNLKPFQNNAPVRQSVDWRIGMPESNDQADLIVLFGGDGTIHRNLNQMVRLGLPVLVVPAGSGNDFARALGLRCVRDALKAWQNFREVKGNVRSIDLGVVTRLDTAAGVESFGVYFCNVAGVGFDGQVTRRANSLPRWLRGHGGYALTAATTLFRFTPISMKILTWGGIGDWTLRSAQPTTLAAFANATMYGGGMKIAPQARMDDGQLDVCAIGGMHPIKLACMFPTVYSGRHLRIREVNYFQAARVRVETEVPRDVYADGEYVCQTPVEVSVQRGALKVLTL